MDDLLLFTAVGFAAQIVDGALGMAYGITATTVLLSIGVTPSVASASVHAAEVVTTGVSGYAHWRHGNVDPALFKQLVLPGMVGAIAGAYVLATVPDDLIQPWIGAYLLIMGGVILWKALRQGDRPARPLRSYAPLGLVGGFLDAAGGGGWGPIVASTLVGSGIRARFAIGSGNAAEFFMTSTASATFIATIGLELWPTIAGLILGGAIAAPFAARITQRLPDRPLMILVAVVVILLSSRTVLQALF